MERVYTVEDYYDGPVSGIADLDGVPHYYECIFDESNDEYSNLYRLSRISEKAFQLSKEQWQMWLRWSEAFNEGKVEANTHPVLPEDKERNSEIEKLISREKLISEENHCVRQAEFIAPGKPGWASEWFVVWHLSST